MAAKPKTTQEKPSPDAKVVKLQREIAATEKSMTGLKVAGKAESKLEEGEEAAKKLQLKPLRLKGCCG